MRSWGLVLFFLASACSVLSGCSQGSFELGAPRILEGPAPPGSTAPNLAVGLDERLYLSWIESRAGRHALRFSTWSDNAWSPPRTIAAGEDWFVNWADIPSMAVLEDGTIAAHWLVKSGGEAYAYDVQVALSRDAGATWSDPVRPHGDGTKTEHGFVSLVATAEGNFEILWLDGRNTGRPSPGPMTLRHATLEADGELAGEMLVDDRVCDCCSTDALRTGDGAMLVAYRDRSSSEVRDISVSRLSESKWSTPSSVHNDNWEIAACPVNGPALASDGETVAIAWFTAARGMPSVHLAFSTNGGRSFGPPLRIDEGRPHGRVDVVMADDGSALVSWLEGSDDEARILIRRAHPSGTSEPSLVAVTTGSRSSGVPRMVRFEDTIVVAWTEPTEPSRVRTAALSISAGR
jgi:hypothetical protein